MQTDRSAGADVRQHGRARPCLGRRRKRGQHEQALGRSRGGFSCKLHLKTDFDGPPIGLPLAGGEVSDSTRLATSLEIWPDVRPRAALTDGGYGSKANRAAPRAGIGASYQ